MFPSNCELNLVKEKWCNAFERCLVSGPCFSSKYWSSFSTGLPAWDLFQCTIYFIHVNHHRESQISWSIRLQPNPDIIDSLNGPFTFLLPWKLAFPARAVLPCRLLRLWLLCILQFLHRFTWRRGRTFSLSLAAIFSSFFPHPL